MKKLTAENCRKMIAERHQLLPHDGLTIDGGYQLQALEIALPILEQQERGCEFCGDDGYLENDHGELGIEQMTCPYCLSKESVTFTGISPNHIDKNLQPGEYIVEIKTAGGAAIINGNPEKNHEATEELWGLIFETIHASKDLVRLEKEFSVWAERHPDMHGRIGRDWIAAEEEHQINQLHQR